MKKLLQKTILLSTLALFGLNNSAKAQWVTTNCNGTGTNAGNFKALATRGNQIFAGSSYNGIFLSEDQGVTWTTLTNGLTGYANFQVQSLTIDGINIFAGTDHGLFLSMDTGSTWQAINTGLTGHDIRAVMISGAKVFASTADAGIFSSTDYGNTWVGPNTGVPFITYAFAIAGNNILAGTDNGIYISADNGSTWTYNSSNMNDNVYSLVINGSNIFAGARTGVYLSNDNGSTWTKQTGTGLFNNHVKALIINGNSLIAGTQGGVSVSTNDGVSWTSDTLGIVLYQNSITVNAFAISGNTLFAGLQAVGVYKQTITAGINKISEKNNLNVYPNPANDILNINGITGKTTIKIYNVLGALIYELPVNNTHLSIDINQFTNGVYTLVTESGNSKTTNKIIINK